MTATKTQVKRPGRPILSTIVKSAMAAEARAVAAERGVSVSALLRDGLDLILAGDAGGDEVVAPLNNEQNKEERSL